MERVHGTLYACIFAGLLAITQAHLNLYMDAKETFRLLGVSAQLYYVRNGIINKYALSFDLPIDSGIDDVFFTWQSLRQLPAMYYSMAFNVSNPKALGKPHPNISMEGTVPIKLSVFQVTFPCTGLMRADVEVSLQLNVSIFSAANLTVLNFKRRKACRRDKMNVPKMGNDTRVQFVEVQNLNSSTHVFYIAVGCACAVILLIAATVAAYYLNTQKAGMRAYAERMSDTSSSQALTQQSQLFLRADTPNNVSHNISTGLPSTRRAFTPVSELKPEQIDSMLTEIHVARNRITLGEVLLEGTFGKIYHGTLVGKDENYLESQEDIYVKTVTDQARPDQVNLFLRETCMMKGMSHVNINPLMGSCLDNEQQPLVLYLHSDEGNLKKFLQKCRMSDTGARYTLSTQQLVYMSIQIIKGVQYLHRRKLVHRDIAVRNCIVDSALVVKLTDNALSRDLFPGDYNCLGDNENRPIKWLAIEALLEKRFTTLSDVWAYGVALWELMTLGQQPYSDIDPFEMAAYLQEGYRAAQPINCPDELFSVMACCWAISPDERPKFSQLLTCLTDFYTALGRYI